MSEDTDIDLAIRRLQQWIWASASLLDKAQPRPSARNAISSTLFHLALEHQDAICTLSRQRLHGSALALLRPLYEAIHRGCWLLLCATDEDLRRFQDADKLPERAVRMKALSQQSEELGTLEAEITRVFGDTLHGLTHGGTVQVYARINGTTIEGNHDPANIVTGLFWTSMLGRFAAIYLAWMTDNEALVRSILEAYGATYPKRGL